MHKKAECRSASVASSCSVVTSIISGSATGLSRLFKYLHYWNSVMFPSSVMSQHCNLEIPITVPCCQVVTETAKGAEISHSCFNACSQKSVSHKRVVLPAGEM